MLRVVMDLKAKFVKSFANIPSVNRMEIVAVVDKQPYTWESAYFEIKNGTVISTKILDFMQKVGVL